MDDLTTYITAAVNYYGLIHENELAELYRSHHGTELAITTLREVVGSSLRSDRAVILYQNGLLYEYEATAGDLLNELLEAKKWRPIHKPERTEMLKYVNKDYFEVTPAFEAWKAFVEEHMTGGRTGDQIAREAVVLAQTSWPFAEIKQDLAKEGCHLIDPADQVQYDRRLLELCDNIRLWELNGHTPKEFRRLLGERDDLLLIPEGKLDWASPLVRLSSTIGRNDPCPCGSGRKFKKCCMAKITITQAPPSHIP